MEHFHIDTEVTGEKRRRNHSQFLFLCSPRHHCVRYVLNWAVRNISLSCLVIMRHLGEKNMKSNSLVVLRLKTGS